MIGRQHQCSGVLAVRQTNTQAVAGLKLRRTNHDFRRFLWSPVWLPDLADEFFERSPPASEPSLVFGPRGQASTGIQMVSDAIQDVRFQLAVRPLHVRERDPKKRAIIRVFHLSSEL